MKNWLKRNKAVYITGLTGIIGGLISIVAFLLASRFFFIHICIPPVEFMDWDLDICWGNIYLIIIGFLMFVGALITIPIIFITKKMRKK